jgi:uncharacterized protein (TIGR03435 family)
MRLMGSIARVGTICLAIGTTLAQVAPDPPSFEVASVKVNTRGGHDWSVTRGVGGRFVAENIPVKALMTFAYGVRDQQLSGYPEWTGDLRFDINAKPDRVVPVGPDGDATLRLMVQALLSDRFHLELHREKREVSGYALILAKNGPKLALSAPDAKGPNITTGAGQIRAGKVKMDGLARVLSDQLGQAVVDETGLTADYDFKVEFAPELLSAGTLPAESQKTEDAGNPVARSDSVTIFAALQEQLGLRLASRKVTIEVLVIDHVERPTEN